LAAAPHALVAALGDRVEHGAQLALTHPLIDEAHGNSHLVAIRAVAEGLEVAHAWDADHSYDLARVPWPDIVAGKVRYGLASFYGVGARGPTAQLAPPPRPATLAATLAGRGAVYSTVADATVLVARRGSVTAVALPDRVLWRVTLPRAHQPLAVARLNGVVFVATRVNAGGVDGELGLPHDNDRVFAFAAGK
jgi:hypothetical protein